MGTKNIAYINKEMLVWARSQTPFDVTEKIELEFPTMSAKKVDDWESGIDFPSVTEAKRLASIYKVPFACFYLSDIPEKKTKKYTDRRTQAGTYYNDITYHLWCEMGRLEANRENLLEFIEDLNSIRKIPATANDNIEEIALLIRDFLELKTPLRTKGAYGNNPFNYYRDIIERKDIMVSQLSGISLSEAKGLSLYYDIFPIIGINNKDFDNSKVFSLFHELAHIFRRSSSLCLIDFDERNDSEEKICDKIAAEVLMPKESFKNIAIEYIRKFTPLDSACLQRIGGRFGVSSFAVLIRLKDLDIISNNKFFELYETITNEFEENRKKIEISRKGKNVPVQFHIKYLSQNGYLLPRTVFTSYATGNITLGEMCKALNINSKHIGNIEQAVMYK